VRWGEKEREKGERLELEGKFRDLEEDQGRKQSWRKMKRTGELRLVGLRSLLLLVLVDPLWNARPGEITNKREEEEGRQRSVSSFVPFQLVPVQTRLPTTPSLISKLRSKSPTPNPEPLLPTRAKDRATWN